MQLGSLIKKTNEASCLLTQCSAQGIWPRPCTIMLLGKFYTSSQSAGKKPHYPSVVRFSVSFTLSLSYCPPCTGFLVFHLLTLLNNYFMLKRLISRRSTMWLSQILLCCLKEIVITAFWLKKPVSSSDALQDESMKKTVLTCLNISWGQLSTGCKVNSDEFALYFTTKKVKIE